MSQKLHLVMGGRVRDPQTLEFTDLEKLDLVAQLVPGQPVTFRWVRALWS